MYEGRLVRLRAFERDDLDANHAFVNDYETVRGMISGIPFPSSVADEQRWLEQQTSYTRGEYQFAIEDGGGDLVGRCGVIRLDWKNPGGRGGDHAGHALPRKGLRHGGDGAADLVLLPGDEPA